VLEKAAREEKEKTKSQISLFSGIDKDEDPPLKAIQNSHSHVDDFTEMEKLMFEKELLGFYLTAHPLNSVIDRLSREISHKVSELREETESIRVKTGGLVSGIKRIITKNGNNEMAFVTLEDERGGSIECIFFPKIFKDVRNKILKDTIILIEGRLDFKDQRPLIIVEKTKTIKA
jgi:DNA polymerase-3 subunit alpha